ncbi:MAG: AbrB/MazE/SpoVT family DNA-binding domain-containing protein, partial [Beijerinckiaceae bacterium]
MQIAKWGNSLAIRIPKRLADELGLKEGDAVEIRRSGERSLELEKADKRAAAIARMAERKWELPDGYKFDR